MLKELIETKIGLADSELVSYQKEGASLRVNIEAWNESIITVDFKNVIRLLDNDLGYISAFIKLSESDFLNTALQRLYVEKIPRYTPYNHFQLLDNDQNASLEIVCSQMNISYSGQ